MTSATRPLAYAAGSAPWRLLVLLAAAGAGLLAAALGDRSPLGYVTVGALALPALGAAIVYRATSVPGHPWLLHPSGLIVVQLLLYYFARPAYQLWTGQGGSATLGYFGVSAREPRYAFVLVLAAVATMVFALGAAFGAKLSPRNTIRSLSERVRPDGVRWIGLIVAFTVSSAAGWQVLRSLLRFRVDLTSSLTLRHLALEGSSSLVLLMSLYKWAFLFYLAIWLQGPRSGRLHPLIVGGLWAPTALFDLISGSRAELMLKNVLIVASIFAFASVATRANAGRRPYASRRSRTRRILALGLLATIGLTIFLGVRVLIRGAGDYDSPLSAVKAVPALFLAGSEANALDVLYLVVGRIDGGLEYRGWETAGVITSAPLPGQLLAQKLERAGHILTPELRPALYRRGGNIAVSGLADLYFTGGTAVALAGFFVIGLLCGLTLQMNQFASGRSSLLVLVVVWALGNGYFSALRSDLAALGSLPVRVGVVVLALLLVVRFRTAASEDSPLATTASTS